MKRWQIVYLLPLEVWMDIFCYPWISRGEFGRLVDRIGNFKFAEHAQFYLHEWGKRTLSYMYFNEDGLRNGIPQTPLPPNIKSFDSIAVDHFGANTLDFLTRIKPLLTDLEISVGDIPSNNFANLRTILTILAPMLGGIRAVYCGGDNSMSTFSIVKEQFLQENEKLAKLKVLEINEGSADGTVSAIQRHENVNFITNWLTQANNAGPRLFELRTDIGFSEQIFGALRQQFLVAKTPSTFAVNLIHDCDTWKFERVGIRLENGIGEVLHCEWTEWTEIGEEVAFRITRYATNWNTKEAREWIKANTERGDHRCIWIEYPTIGAIDAAAQMGVPQVDEGTVQQACSSKDA